jgi:LuxR family transcriptional regulator, quorum-sensing system regulator CinR
MTGAPSEKYSIVFETIARVGNVRAAIDIMSNCYNIPCISYYMSRVPGFLVMAPFFKTNYPVEWVDYYIQNCLMLIDPVVKHGLTRTYPFIWQEMIPPDDAKEITAAMAMFGLTPTGFTVPITDPKGRRALVSFHYDDSAVSWVKDFPGVKTDLENFASDLHQKAITEMFAIGKQSFRQTFSPREIECLSWAAKGKTDAEIGDIIGISKHTVREYTKSVRAKLDCLTIAQAVYLAERMGILPN